MRNIKVGEFIRTNKGVIGKLIRIERDDIDISLKWYVFSDGKNERYVNKPYIVNYSQNIIDLIEEDDIGIMSYGGIIFRKFITKDDIVELKFGNYKLLEIVTKELFSSVKYEVER